MVTKAGPRCFRAVLSGGAASQRTRGLGWCAMHPKGCDDAFSRGGSRLEPPTPGAAPGGDSAPVPGSRFPGSKAGKEFLAPSLFARSYGRSRVSVLVCSLFVSGLAGSTTRAPQPGPGWAAIATTARRPGWQPGRGHDCNHARRPGWPRVIRPACPEPVEGRQLLEPPAASAFTSLVVKGFPATPQSPLLTSSMTTHVTGRMLSPSIDTIVSVSLRIISCFCFGVKTPSRSFTFTSGIGFLSGFAPGRGGRFEFPPSSPIYSAILHPGRNVTGKANKSSLLGSRACTDRARSGRRPDRQ